VVATLRRRPKDPEGRMPLRAHLVELRNRLVKAGIAIVLGAVAGWFLYGPVFSALMRPLYDVARDNPDRFVSVNFGQVASPFNLQLRLSFYLGFLVSSPVWLYQLWAFIVPGLTKREKRYSMAFVAAGVPLLFGGIALAWLVLPNAVRFLTDFTPAGASNIIIADDYLTFVLRIMLMFGVAFVTPLLLVALNMAGVVSAVTLAKGWRVAVFLCFLFAAIASPTPDVGTMLALAFPMVGLYLVAVGISWVVDRRRRRRRGEDFGDLSDDEASPLPAAEPFDPLPADADDRYDSYAPDAPDASDTDREPDGIEAGERPHRPHRP
jgi:sec-independent protein translocase protein TatC